jgi:hypothetical protein
MLFLAHEFHDIERLDLRLSCWYVGGPFDPRLR